MMLGLKKRVFEGSNNIMVSEDAAGDVMVTHRHS